jgi:hypothetical protein
MTNLSTIVIGFVVFLYKQPPTIWEKRVHLSRELSTTTARRFAIDEGGKNSSSHVRKRGGMMSP